MGYNKAQKKMYVYKLVGLPHKRKVHDINMLKIHITA